MKINFEISSPHVLLFLFKKRGQSTFETLSANHGSSGG